MAKMYDISMQITNELPVIKITDSIIVSVNNRKSTILNIQAMALEAERKATSNPENVEDDAEFKQMQKALAMLIGEENAKDIDELDLPIDEYKKVYESIMKVAQGMDPSTPSK